MHNLSLDQQQLLQQELNLGESVLWAGKPNASVVFHPPDWYMIPFSLLWGGFAIFWESWVSGGFGSNHDQSAPWFFMLWGVPFVLIGQYFIWGRFLYSAWKKSRIIYAVTNRRVLVLALSPGRKVISSFIENIPVIDKEVRSDAIGTLKFGNINNAPWGNNRNGTLSMDGLFLGSGVPVFVDIDDSNSVYAIVAGLKNKVRN